MARCTQSESNKRLQTPERTSHACCALFDHVVVVVVIVVVVVVGGGVVVVQSVVNHVDRGR